MNFIEKLFRSWILSQTSIAEVGKQYITEREVGSFYPMIKTVTKVNNTHVLFEQEYKGMELGESEMTKDLFEFLHVPYKPNDL